MIKLYYIIYILYILDYMIIYCNVRSYVISPHNWLILMLPAATRTMAEVAAAQNLPHLETEHFEALTLEDIQQLTLGWLEDFMDFMGK